MKTRCSNEHGLSGNSKDRRKQYRKLCRIHGKDNVGHTSNPDSDCNNTRVMIREDK